MDAFTSAEEALNVGGAVVYGDGHTAVTHRPSTGGMKRTANGAERPRALRPPPRPTPGGRRHDGLSATGILSVTHIVALLLILLSAVLFKHSAGDHQSATPWLFLGQGVMLAFLGSRLYRNKLLLLARRRGLNDADAKAYAKEQMLQLTERLRQSKAELQAPSVLDTARVSTSGTCGPESGPAATWLDPDRGAEGRPSGAATGARSLRADRSVPGKPRREGRVL